VDVMYVFRELEKQVNPFLDRKEVIAIVGARQVGKTTFLQYLQHNLEKVGKVVKFITFEKKSDLLLFQNQLEDFKDLYKQYQVVIIDEFQYAKDGGKKLKYLYDTTQIKFIISGSSSLELTFQTGKYMVGRMFNFSLYPFSFREFLSVADKELYLLIQERIPNPSLEDFNLRLAFGSEINLRLERLMERYLIWGGYPAVVLANTDEERKKILEGILENYLLRVINSLLQLASEGELINLIKALATQIGNLIVYKELSNVCGLTYKELIKHLQILKQTYIIDLIKPYFTNKRTELVKNPKVYFLDTGLRNLALLDFRALQVRNDIGSLVENYTFSFLKQKLTYLERLNFWRTKSQAEIDFVIEKHQKVIPIEVKYSLNPSIGKSLYSFIHKFSPDKAIILTKGVIGEKKINNCWIKFIPVYYF